MDYGGKRKKEKGKNWKCGKWYVRRVREIRKINDSCTCQQVVLK